MVSRPGNGIGLKYWNMRFAGCARQALIWHGRCMIDGRLKRVDWFNNRCLLRLSGNIPPAEAEQSFYAQHDLRDMAA